MPVVTGLPTAGQKPSADGKRIVLFDDNVNSNNVSTAIANAGENTTVILNGDYTGVNTLTTLQQGQQILGSANLKVKTPSGRSVNITTPSASLSGTGSNGGGGSVRFFDMADNSSLIGVKAKITNSSTAIIAKIEGKDNVKILNNTLTSEVSSFTAATLEIRNSRNVTIRNNTMNVIANGLSGLGIAFADNNANIDFSNNSLNIGGTAATLRTYILAAGVTINNLSGTGNTSNLATCYISGGYTITGSIETNGINLCPP
ncbi:hypothetical protein LCGC14_2500290 [marine sediment metagenome]|uniref:Right handed beta helix domain-containing protein n=1 Tax=marine sediment metagenome TaxID=412755 RepID=A0A0F9B207_9ZZZZ